MPARVSADRRARPHAAVARRGPRTLRRDRASGPSADPRVLARAHPARHLLLPPSRHRRHHQRELRRRVDRADHRALRLRHGARIDLARRARARCCSCAATWRRAAPRDSPSTARAGRRGARSPGAVWLAGATGNPLLPFHIEAARHWTTRSWDRTQIPRPFTTVALVVGSPIDVPREPPAEAIETKRVELEQALHALEVRAREMLLASSRARAEPTGPGPSRPAV